MHWFIHISCLIFLFGYFCCRTSFCGLCQFLWQLSVRIRVVTVTLELLTIFWNSFCGLFTIDFFLFYCATILRMKYLSTRLCIFKILGGGQNLERPNVEDRYFRISKFLNIKRSEDKLFDFLNFQFIFYFDISLNCSNIQNIW